ncbi:MAG: SulP family inorganic anion transporter [Bernardetiaceae bacterium]|nr:SulP family inorganic anion transporter [Bernardetiaceae bacterium]
MQAHKKKVINIFAIDKSVDYKTEVLAGLTVALTMVPSAVAFSIMADLSPLTGLYAAFVVGLVTAVLGGRPGMISGSAGAIAIILVELTRSHGVEYIFATAVLAGLIQFVVGALRWGKFMRLVPQPVMFGFVNGLAILIFLSQVGQFKTPEGEWLPFIPFLGMLGLVLLSMLIIWGLPRFTKAVPSSLVAIIVIFLLVWGLGIETKTVGDIASIKGGFPPFHIPEVPFTLETFMIILPYALIMASVGLIESLLTLNLIDEITETRGWSNTESMALGVANIASGFFSGMGGCGLVGQSLVNISSGARARVSSIVSACLILFFIMIASSFIEQVPMAALVGLMIMVAIGTFEWVSIRSLDKMPKHDIFVMILVMFVTVVLHNLALAVLIGVLLSALVFAWESAKRIRARQYTDEQGVKHYEIFGPLFFGSTKAFSEKFDVLGDPEKVVINFKESRISDMSAIDTVNKITERYAKVNKTVYLRYLSEDSRTLLDNANKVIEVNILEDPTYKVPQD